MKFLTNTVLLGFTLTSFAQGFPPAEMGGPDLTDEQRECLEEKMEKPKEGSRPNREKMEKVFKECGISKPGKKKSPLKTKKETNESSKEREDTEANCYSCQRIKHMEKEIAELEELMGEIKQKIIAQSKGPESQQMTPNSTRNMNTMSGMGTMGGMGTANGQRTMSMGSMSYNPMTSMLSYMRQPTPTYMNGNMGYGNYGMYNSSIYNSSMYNSPLYNSNNSAVSNFFLSTNPLLRGQTNYSYGYYR